MKFPGGNRSLHEEQASTFSARLRLWVRRVLRLGQTQGHIQKFVQTGDNLAMGFIFNHDKFTI